MNNPIFHAETIARLRGLMEHPRTVVITTHHKPDGDALGSSLGLMHVLRRCGHRVQVVLPSEYPGFLNWMSGADETVDFIRSSSRAVAALEQAELVFCLDFNDPARVEAMEEALLKSQATKVLVDHHLDPKTEHFHVCISLPSQASTSEIIVHLAVVLELDHLLDRNAAECLYAGIMTDTGSFRFNSVTASTHRAVARLMDAGVRNDWVFERIYDHNSEKRIRFLGFTLLEKMKVIPEFSTVIMTASQEDMDRFEHAPGDLEGIVNYGLSISGMKMSVLFSQRDGLVKISFRSKGAFSVKEIAEKHFHGGGHRNAAGGRSNAGLESAVQTFIDLLPNYEKELRPESL